MIERRTTASGDVRYEVRLRGPDGKERSRTFRTRSEARAFEASELAKRNRGDWIDRRLSTMPFAEVAREWFESNPAKRASSRARDEITLRRHLLPRFGTTALRDLTPGDVQRWVNEHARQRAPRTVRRDFGVLRAVLNHAVERDLIARTPCRGINLPRPEKLERPVLDAEALGRLADELGPYGPMAYLAAVLGLRWGEIAGLRVRRIDFPAGTIAVAEQVVRDERGASVMGPPKSDAGHRTLAAPEWLLSILEEHLGERVDEPDEFVFTDSAGGHLAYSSWRTRVWDPAAVRAGLATLEEDGGRSHYEGVTFHDLRRANATALVGTGVDVKTAQRRLGHSDVRLTLDVYAQAVDDLDRVAAERVGSHFRPAESAPESDRGRREDDGKRMRGQSPHRSRDSRGIDLS